MLMLCLLYYMLYHMVAKGGHLPQLYLTITVWASQAQLQEHRQFWTDTEGFELATNW